MMSRLDLCLEDHRAELRAHCRRLLGSAFDADDAVQETMIRAWRNLDRFEGRSGHRAWLYRIATNVCIDVLRHRARHPGPVDPAAADGRSRDAGGMPEDPAEVVVAREALHDAITAAVQLLPPRQRAALVLRDGLRWRADEIADLLGTTRAAVNSALQRARATLALQDVGATDPLDGSSGRRAPARHRDDRGMVARCVIALTREDVDSLVSLLRADAAA
jgi:RNA polymerase sigma-70 factor (ECF subfamily)